MPKDKRWICSWADGKLLIGVQFIDSYCIFEWEFVILSIFERNDVHYSNGILRDMQNGNTLGALHILWMQIMLPIIYRFLPVINFHQLWNIGVLTGTLHRSVRYMQWQHRTNAHLNHRIVLCILFQNVFLMYVYTVQYVLNVYACVWSLPWHYTFWNRMDWITFQLCIYLMKVLYCSSW